MPLENTDWEEFYRKVRGREPRPLLFNALERFAFEPAQGVRTAIDLGCGDGTESTVLLARGWNVLAIDAEPAAISHLMTKVAPEHQAQLQTQVATFEEVALSPADLVFASFSIPFCHPQHFGMLWQKIVNALTPGGRFAGQFFGVRDSWADTPTMTFHTEEEVRAMLEGFDIEFFHEEDEDGYSTVGPKHWHVFTVVAKKR